MKPLDLVNLRGLMEITSGNARTIVGLIDGPVAKNHPDLTGEKIRIIPGKLNSQCTQSNDIACTHGTFVAGILCGKKNSIAPAICPNCNLLVRPIFAENTAGNGQIPNATPEELAAAIIQCLEAGAKLLNLSIALAQLSSGGQYELKAALDYAVKRGAIVVAAAGNHGTLGSSVITRHPGVIPVVACDLQGKPISQSNLGRSIGSRGLSAPGDKITSLGTNDKPLVLSGTSVAAPFVTGTIALLQSEFPAATITDIRYAVTQADGARRTSVVPPLLDAWTAYQVLAKVHSSRR
ncbi:S8 family serine peptidase [Pleurocapsales cyanobacterium LEGE 10410]|nr:S8 family serine peptidase [Pleurocapsales cyanobacterium LEGE 10410]